MKPAKKCLERLVSLGVNDIKIFMKVTGQSRRTINRDLKKIREGKELERQAGSGRPRKFGSNDKRRLLQLALKNVHMSSNKIAIEMKKRGSPKAAPSTIRKYLNEAGIWSMVPKFIPKLTPLHKEKRVKWCKDHKKTRFGRWIFTDESMFELYSNRVGVWSKTRPKKEKPKWNPRLMVWGAISVKGKSILVKIRDKIDSKKYQEILEKALPSIRKILPKFILMQDGATPHTSRSTKNWLSSNNISVASWPPNSPDLNPIENVWGLMKREVERQNPRNMIDLEKIIDNVWDGLTIKYFKTLFQSIPRRIQSCIALKGEKTKY